ncbi:MAG: substrate-binding domain-containing protein [Thermoleophilaceae bacterium]
MTRSRTRVLRAAVFAMASLSLSCAGAKPARVDNTPIHASKTLGTTHGPSGERATPTSALELTPAEVAKVRAGHYTAALLWHEDADFTTAVTGGVRDVFKQLGIEVVARASANFDAARQKAQLETIGAKKPSVLLTLPVDPVLTASAYKAVARRGTKIVLLSIVPQGMRAGRDYVDVVTDDLFQMGKRAADALAVAVGDKGNVAYFFRDANSYVTNQRDQAFLKTLTRNYPNIDVVAKQGIADPNKAQDEANAVLLENPKLSGAYVTFSQPPAEGVLASLRANGNTTTKIVSLDLDEPLALDMAKGGNTFALIADRAYELGQAMAKSAAYGLLGKKAPAFVVASAMTITKANLVQGYRESLHRDPPASVMKALGK